MPSTPTTRNRLEKQGPGENENTWGTRLNNGAFDRLDEALDGVTKFTLSANKTLTSSNYVADEARARILWVTGGTGGTVFIPGVEKLYHIVNDSTGAVVISTGGGQTATVASGVAGAVICDGTDVRADTGTQAGQAISAAEQATQAAQQATNAAQAAQAAVASVDPANIVHIIGNETVQGVKAFANGIVINGQALNALTAAGVGLIHAANVTAQRALLGLGSAALTNTATQAQVRAHSGNAAITAAGVASAAEVVQLTDAATITVDWTAFITAYVTLGGNRTLGNPAGAVPGTTRVIFVEAASGTRELSFASNYKGANGVISDVGPSKRYMVTLIARTASDIVTLVTTA